MMSEKTNILLYILGLLKVKHTANYATTYYEEHPHKYDLSGIAGMLSHYGIETACYRLEKGAISWEELQAPFVAHLNESFAVVTAVREKELVYFLDGEIHTVSHATFETQWSGVVLFFEKQEISVEPNYQEHRRNALLTSGLNFIFGCSVLLLLVLPVFGKVPWRDGSLLGGILLNLFGIYVSYLLVLKQLNVKNKHADKICSAFQTQSNCQVTLNSSASKLFGMVSLSEIGLGYFMANVFMTLYFPELYIYQAWCNVLALPFSLWCIGYQRIALRQWCPLCLLVQLCIWGIFGCYVMGGLIRLPSAVGWEVGYVPGFYGIFIGMVHWITGLYAASGRVSGLKYQLNAIKANKNVFFSFLDKSRRFEIDNDLGIFIGNRESDKTVTVVTNPHCSPCAQLHAKIHEYMKGETGGVCFQLILSSFNKRLEKSARLILYHYHHLEKEDFVRFLYRWYNDGQKNPEAFYDRYPFEENDEALNQELDRHKAWINANRLYATPTVLLNGYIFPEDYEIGDLVLIENMVIEGGENEKYGIE